LEQLKQVDTMARAWLSGAGTNVGLTSIVLCFLF